MIMRKNNDDLLMSILQQNQTLVEQYINKNKMQDVDYDENFESISKKNISDRDDSYTDLLKHFVNITKIRNRVKEIHKWLYFWIIMAITIVFVISVSSLLRDVELTNEKYVNNLVIIVTSIISFSSVLISIPLIITKYLFSSKEDKRIANIILHTQQHDIDGKKLLEDIKNIDRKLDKLESTSKKAEANNQDSLIELVTRSVQTANNGLQKTENSNQIEEQQR